MIDLRIISALGIPVVQCIEHTYCCAYGTCDAPDKVTYQTPVAPVPDGEDVASVLTLLIHGYLSELADEQLSWLLQ